MRLPLSVVLLLTSTSLSAFAQYQQPQNQQPQNQQPHYQWGKPKPPITGACFYKDSNFRGDYFCMKLGDNWPYMPSGFNDKITAIRLFNGAQVRIFNDSNFKGVNSRITRDVSDLHHYKLPDNPSKNWNDRISSMAVYRANDGWDRGHP
jgi:Peptidase inhibitor family I36